MWGVKYLTGPEGFQYSGWFMDADENWYYFNESDKTMKTGWHHDLEDGYWYYLNPSDGKMAYGWQTIARWPMAGRPLMERNITSSQCGMWEITISAMNVRDGCIL